MKTSNRRKIFILVFALLVVMLGFGMVILVFPSIIDKLGASGRWTSSAGRGWSVRLS